MPDLDSFVEFTVHARYPVVFTEDLFSPANPVLARTLSGDTGTACPPRRMRVLLDNGLVDAQPELPARIMAYGRQLVPELALEPPAVYPGGECIKNDRVYVDRIVEELAERRMCRHSVVIAVGGGAFLDAVGFAAALVHRGVRLLRIPSTTLSQGDSGVGTKNGINAAGQKNFLGTFMPPWAVINDFQLLRTLSPDLVLDGVAEAFKVAIIKDAEFFGVLRRTAAQLRDSGGEALREAIRRSAEMHAQHIMTGGDPFEMGTSRPLDFGHWAAHRLESLSDYRLRHGQAVAIGIALDSRYAESIGLIPAAQRETIHAALMQAGLAIYDPLLGERDSSGKLRVMDGIEQFREHLGGQLAITLPNPIGSRTELSELDEAAVEEAVQFLEARATEGAV